jgi:hypothetical protein
MPYNIKMNKLKSIFIVLGIIGGISVFAQDSLFINASALLNEIRFDTTQTYKPNEYDVNCWFNFINKPSSYYYEVNIKEKTLKIGFNDAKSDSTTIPSTFQKPIQVITINNNKFNIHKKSEKPEMHDQINIIIKLANVPKFEVVDFGDTLLFTYKWTSNENDINRYEIKPIRAWPYILILFLLFLGGAFIIKGA